MPIFAALLAALSLAAAIPASQAQASEAQIRARAIANCKTNRGTDCSSAAGLMEWIDAERPRPTGQRSAIVEQKLEAARKAQQGGAAGETALRRAQGTR